MKNSSDLEPIIAVNYKSEIRCPNPDFRGTGHPCNRLLCKGELQPGSAIEYKCPKCGDIYKFEVIA